MKSLGIVVIARLLVSFYSGCSLTLAGLTAINEERSEHEALIPLDELQVVAPGSTVRVHLTSGITEEGKLVDTQSLPEGQALRLKQEQGE